MGRLCLWVLLWPSWLLAADPAGVVMRVEDKELFVNLGRRDGVRAGTRLDLYRRVTLTHPITRKVVEDRFPIGQVEVTEAGELLSIVRTFAELARPPAAGDFAVLAPPPPPVVAAAPTSEVVVVAGDPAEGSLHGVLKANLGQPPAVQAAALQVWREAYPAHALTPAVDRAIAALTTQDQAPARTEPARTALAMRHVPVKRIEAGRVLELTLGVVEAAEVVEARLLVRGLSEGLWTTVVMTPAGDHHWRAQVPAARLAEPRVLEYALEVVRKDGRTETAGADLLTPNRLVVEPRPPGEEGPGASHADFTFRWVNFDVGGNDAYWQTEARYRYTVAWRALRTVEAGAGLLQGEGGSVEALEAGEAAQPAALGYAFGAVELTLGEFVGIGTRITGGNSRPRERQAGESLTGVQGQLRLGRDDGTHLRLGAAALGDLGSRFYADFFVRALDRLPITASAEATNLPVAADYGLRLTGDVGWQATDWLTLRVEAGWNARTISHYGFTTGLGLSMDWE